MCAFRWTICLKFPSGVAHPVDLPIATLPVFKKLVFLNAVKKHNISSSTYKTDDKYNVVMNISSNQFY